MVLGLGPGPLGSGRARASSRVTALPISFCAGLAGGRRVCFVGVSGVFGSWAAMTVPVHLPVGVVGPAAEFDRIWLALTRVLTYLGVVMLIGTSFFWEFLWPNGRRDPILRRLVLTGAALIVAGSLMLLPTHATNPAAGPVGLLIGWRLLLIALGTPFAAGEFRRAHRRAGQRGGRRLFLVLWHLAVIETFVLLSDAWGERWSVVKIAATTGHLYATAAWLGGLLALAAVLIPRYHLGALDEVIPKFSAVAVVSVVVLTLTGTLHALAVMGSVHALRESRYGLVLAVKVLLFAAMLLLGNEGRRYAVRLAHRPASEMDGRAPSAGVTALAVAIGAEFALAIGVLAATAALVAAAPRPH